MLRHSFLAAAVVASLLPLRAGAQSQRLPVRIATIPLGTGLEPQIAQELGFYDKAGLDATVETIATGAQITAAVVSGSIEIGFSNLLSVAQAYERGLPVVALFPGTLSLTEQPNGAIMVPKDSKITSGRDLNGKTVGIPGLGNMSQLAPMAWIDQHGGDSKTVRWVQIPFEALAAALDQHRVDAANLTDPFVTAAKAKDRILGNPLDAIAPRFTSNAWFATKAWAQAHPETVARFISATRQTALWANSHPREMIPLMSKYLKVREADLAQLPPETYADAFVVSEFQPLLDAAAKYGFIQRRVTADELSYNAAASR